MNDFRKYIDIVDEENIANEGVLDWVADKLGYKPKDPKLGELVYKHHKMKNELAKLQNELNDIERKIKNHPEFENMPRMSTQPTSSPGGDDPAPQSGGDDPRGVDATPAEPDGPLGSDPSPRDSDF